MDYIICRYGEIALKGKNRILFERQLVDNIKDCLNRNSIQAQVKRARGRIFVITSDEKALSCLRKVFGLVSISPAVTARADVEEIKNKVLEYTKSIISGKKSFRITAKRIDKRFPKTSHEMDIILGDLVNETLGLEVDLHNPDLNICVEIQDAASIFIEKLECFGGLPIGMGGNVVCIIEKEQDILAAWLMMKRGCRVFCLVGKGIDVSLLEKFSYGPKIIRETLNYAAINDFVALNKCKAVVSGDTLEEFNKDRYQGLDVILLTPLIGYDKKDIKSNLLSIK